MGENWDRSHLGGFSALEKPAWWVRRLTRGRGVGTDWERQACLTYLSRKESDREPEMGKWSQKSIRNGRRWGLFTDSRAGGASSMWAFRLTGPSLCRDGGCRPPALGERGLALACPQGIRQAGGHWPPRGSMNLRKIASLVSLAELWRSLAFPS